MNSFLALRQIALRRLLLVGVPAAIAMVAVYFYALGGRYVATANAYIKADRVQISAQVDGPITRSRGERAGSTEHLALPSRSRALPDCAAPGAGSTAASPQ